MKVKSIEYAGKADVYNMEVDDTHDYVVNGGIVSHNCYDAVRYVAMAHVLNPAPVMMEDMPADDPLNMWSQPKYNRGGIYA